MLFTSGDVVALKQSQLLVSLGRETAATLIDMALPTAMTMGSPIFRQTDEATAFYIVLDGWVALSRGDEHGHSSVIDLLGRGESFAEALVIPGATYPVSAYAASAVRLARFDIEAVRALLLSNSELPLSIIASLLHRLHRLVQRVERDSTWSTPRRVAGFLLLLCDGRDDACSFDLPVEQQMIAARLSMTPTTFSRALGGLSRVGVSANRGCVAIESVRRLRQFAHDGEVAP